MRGHLCILGGETGRVDKTGERKKANEGEKLKKNKKNEEIFTKNTSKHLTRGGDSAKMLKIYIALVR